MKYLTRKGVAEMLSVSTKTVSRYVKSEKLPCIRVKRKLLFEEKQIIEWLNQGKINANEK